MDKKVDEKIIEFINEAENIYTKRFCRYENGYLYLRCLIDDSVNFKNVIEATTEDEIIIYEQQDEENIENTDINL